MNLKKSILDYAIKGSLTTGFRRENPNLNAKLEILAFNKQVENKKEEIKNEIENKENEIKKLESKIKEYKKAAKDSSDSKSSNLIVETNLSLQELKTQIRELKKDSLKLKVINIENVESQTSLGDKISFKIPPSWAWVRLGDICEIYTGDSINADLKQKEFTNKEKGVNYIATKDINNRIIDYENGVKITDDFIHKFKIAKEDSTLLCIEGGSAGRKIGFLEQSVCFGNKLCCFEPHFANAKFVYFYLQSSVFLAFFNTEISGIIGGVNKDKLPNFKIPLPPLKEQEFIAKKLEELFVLTKELKT